MDAKKLWWVSELLAKDCEKAWFHTGCEDTMQKWYEWQEHMKKKDEKEKMEEMHQRKVQKMVKSAAGSPGLLHKITKANDVEERSTDPEEKGRRRECAGTLRSKKKKNGQNICSAMRKLRSMQKKPWRNEELKECEEALPRLKEGDLEKASRLYKAKNRCGMRRIPNLELNERNERKN